MIKFCSLLQVSRREFFYDFMDIGLALLKNACYNIFVKIYIKFYKNILE